MPTEESYAVPKKTVKLSSIDQPIKIGGRRQSSCRGKATSTKLLL